MLRNPRPQTNIVLFCAEDTETVRTSTGALIATVQPSLALPGRCRDRRSPRLTSTAATGSCHVFAALVDAEGALSRHVRRVLLGRECNEGRHSPRSGAAARYDLSLGMDLDRSHWNQPLDAGTLGLREYVAGSYLRSGRGPTTDRRGIGTSGSSATKLGDRQEVVCHLRGGRKEARNDGPHSCGMLKSAAEESPGRRPSPRRR